MDTFIHFVSLVVLAFTTWWTGVTIDSLPLPAAPTEEPATTTATVISVIDGDTIMVRMNGRDETVRYIGIDTPEPRRDGDPECGSAEATEFNRQLVSDQTVLLVTDREDRDRFGRLLRYVYVETTDGLLFVNAEILRAGYARPLTISPNDTHASSFTALASAAATSGVGNWGRCR